MTSYHIPIALNRLPFIIEKHTHEDGVMHGKHLRVAEGIKDLTEPDDLILIWGAETGLHLLSGRDAPTRFFYQYPLALSRYARSSVFEEFLDDVKSGEPVLIVDTRNSRLPPLRASERDGWKMDGQPSAYVYSPDRFQPFFDFVEEKYEFMGEMEGYAIYRRTDSSPSSSTSLY